MCDDHPQHGSPSRRQLLGAAVPLLGLAVAARHGSHSGARRSVARAVEPAPGLAVTPRHEWGGHLRTTGSIPAEPDVRILVVHHSVNANTYGPADVVGLLTGIHRFHTGDKGWPDIAYNFFVDRFGGVWEGRAGSLDSQVAGDATGGNQGYSQLCCFVGDHRDQPPSPEAQESMGRLLAWLAERAGVDPSPGARASFTSRGSNRHRAGSLVDLPTICGHRDVSQTECPGDAAHQLVTGGSLATIATARRPAAPSTTSTVTTTEPGHVASPPEQPVASTSPTTAAADPTGPETPEAASASAVAEPEPDGQRSGARTALEVGAAASVGAAVVFGTHALRSRDTVPTDD